MLAEEDKKEEESDKMPESGVSHKRKHKRLALENLPVITGIPDLIDIGKNIRFYDNIDTITLWRIHPFLEELQNMIGMDSLKQTVFYQLLYYIQGMNIRDKSNDYLHTAIYGAPGTGKCLGKDTGVLTDKYEIKLVQNIRVGDRLLGDDNMPRTVTGITTGNGVMYDISQTLYGNEKISGLTYCTNEHHILSLVLVRSAYITEDTLSETYHVHFCDDTDLGTVSLSYANKDKRKVYTNALRSLRKCPKIGYTTDISVFSYLYERSTEWKACFKGYRIRPEFPYIQTRIDPYILGIWLVEKKHQQFFYYHRKDLHIPNEYVCNSLAVRADLVAGIFDSCTRVKNTVILPEDFEFVPELASLLHGLGVLFVQSESTIILLGNTHFLNTQTPILTQTYRLIYDLHIQKRGVGLLEPYYGFTLDGNKRFLLSDGTVTHNSSVATIIGRIYQGLNLLSHDGPVRIAHRDDFIAGYLGQTAIKTRNFLESCIGGVLIVDEAYALAPRQNDRDSFSKEALDTLTAFLSEHKSDFCCIIVGYEDEIRNCFFNMNKGLERRFPWVHRIETYTAEELTQIFRKMVAGINWSIGPPDNDLTGYLESQVFSDKKLFTHAGGDIETFLGKCKLCHSKRVFGLDDKLKFILTQGDIEKGREMYIKHKNNEEEPSYPSMYV